MCELEIPVSQKGARCHLVIHICFSNIALLCSLSVLFLVVLVTHSSDFIYSLPSLQPNVWLHPRVKVGQAKHSFFCTSSASSSTHHFLPRLNQVRFFVSFGLINGSERRMSTMAHLENDALRRSSQLKPLLTPRPETKERRFHITSSLLLEKVRRSTFFDWRTSYVSPEQMAKAGFYYLRTADHVQCIFCQGIVGYWEEGDDPVQEHKKHFPQCALMNGTATGNVPLNVEDEELREVYNLIQEHHDFIVSSTKPRLIRTKYQFDWVRRDGIGKSIAHPQFNTASERKRTFKVWHPNNDGVSLDKIVDAGFFSTGVSDMVVCFHCNGGLFNWKAGDDPWKDHARFYPTCQFVRNTKGEDFVRQCQNENPAPPVISKPTRLSIHETEILLRHPMAKRLLQMGLQDSSVREAFRVAVERDGLVPRSVTDMLEMVFDVEEEMRRNGQSMDVEPETLQQPLVVTRTTDMAPMETDNNENETKVDEEEKLRAQEEQLAAVKKKYETELKVLQCRICQRKKISVVLQPCGHFHLCASCAQPCSKCPSCETVVRGTILPIFG